MLAALDPGCGGDGVETLSAQYKGAGGASGATGWPAEIFWECLHVHLWQGTEQQGLVELRARHLTNDDFQRESSKTI